MIRLVGLSILFMTQTGFSEEVVPSEILPERISRFVVRTRSDSNRELPFFIRTPLGFKAEDKKPRRLLFLCPYLDETGISLLNRSAVYLRLADERGWFVMTCTFKQEHADAKDRVNSYYYPESFSGKAVLDALDYVSKKVPIDTERLFMHGLSGGAQFVHRFAMWAPERVSAVSINSCGWFDVPGASCGQVAWMIIIGEADPALMASFDFSQKLTEVGAAPLYRSYIGMAHEGGWKSVELLTVEWLKFQDSRSAGFLGQKKSKLDDPARRLAMKAEDMPFVGDAQQWTFRENTPENVADLPEDARVFLQSREIGDLWGTYDGGEK